VRCRRRKEAGASAPHLGTSLHLYTVGCRGGAERVAEVWRVAHMAPKSLFLSVGVCCLGSAVALCVWVCAFCTAFAVVVVGKAVVEF
jgi:hypothetical protein